MIVVAIVAILASVAIPAYVNYKHRALQAEAVEALMRAKMDQELFWVEKDRYADTVGCLYSFGNSCSQETYTTPNGYELRIPDPNDGASTYRIVASKTYYGDVVDTLAITESSPNPIISNPDALSFSIFDWLFN